MENLLKTLFLYPVIILFRKCAHSVVKSNSLITASEERVLTNSNRMLPRDVIPVSDLCYVNTTPDWKCIFRLVTHQFTIAYCYYTCVAFLIVITKWIMPT